MLSTESTRIVMVRQGDIEIRYTNRNGQGVLELILAAGLEDADGEPLLSSDASIPLPMEELSSVETDIRLPLSPTGETNCDISLDRAVDGGISVSLVERDPDADAQPLADFPISEWAAFLGIVWSIEESGGIC